MSVRLGILSGKKVLLEIKSCVIIPKSERFNEQEFFKFLNEKGENYVNVLRIEISAESRPNTDN